MSETRTHDDTLFHFLSSGGVAALERPFPVAQSSRPAVLKYYDRHAQLPTPPPAQPGEAGGRPHHTTKASPRRRKEGSRQVAVCETLEEEGSSPLVTPSLARERDAEAEDAAVSPPPPPVLLTPAVPDDLKVLLTPSRDRSDEDSDEEQAPATSINKHDTEQHQQQQPRRAAPLSPDPEAEALPQGLLDATSAILREEEQRRRPEVEADEARQRDSLREFYTRHTALALALEKESEYCTPPRTERGGEGKEGQSASATKKKAGAEHNVSELSLTPQRERRGARVKDLVSPSVWD